MNRSLYTKLIIIILVLILALTLVTGAFLIRGVRNYYVSQFYIQMQDVFSDADLVNALRLASRDENAAEQMADILAAYSRDLGINSGTRNYFILEAKTGAYITGSDPEAGSNLSRTTNILTAIAGANLQRLFIQRDGLRSLYLRLFAIRTDTNLRYILRAADAPFRI